MSIRSLTLLALFLISIPSFANQQLTREIVADIKKTQNEIHTLEKKYSSTLAKLSQQLNQKTSRVEALRKQVAASRRSNDEQDLGIEALRNRVKKWENQNAYQQHLLKSYIDLRKGALGESQPTLSTNFALIDKEANKIQDALLPKWEENTVVDLHGAIASLPTIAIGPSHWYFNPSTQNAGLLKRDEQNTLTISIPFSSAQAGDMQAVFENNRGPVIFDPTLDKVGRYMEDQENVVEHFQKGGIWVFPILFFALLSVVIAIIKSIELYRLPKIIPLVPERVSKALKLEKDEKLNEIQAIYRSTSGAQQELVKIALETKSHAERDDLLVSSLLENKHKLEKLLGIIAITAAIAPLLGLLGTVSGMIETFRMMTIFGTGDPEVVSGGISEALVTTELGLVVAIPALVINAILLRKIKSYNHLLETMAIKLSKVELNAHKGNASQKESHHKAEA